MSMATTSTADQKAAKFSSEPTSSSRTQTRPPTESVASGEAEQERLQRDNDLTREAVTRLAREKYEPLQEKMLALRENYNSSRAALARELASPASAPLPAAATSFLPTATHVTAPPR